MWRFILLCCYSLPILAATPVCNNSIPATVLLELFTSQGCSSCPPAEAWLAKIPAQFDRNQVITLAWHVDYWDYLGWKDEFSAPMFSTRQRERVRASGDDNVYTPQLMINGQTRVWYKQPEDFISPQLHSKRTAEISLTAQQQDHGSWRIDIDSATLPEDTQLRAVLIGETSSRNIASGENAGRLLSHPSPVLAYASRVNNSVNLKPNNGKAVRAVVWLERTQSSEILAISSLDLKTCQTKHS